MSGTPRDLVAALRARGLVHQVTDEALGPLTAKEALSAYIGFDPTADSLHAGSLYPVMLLAHAARAGHRPVALIGGGTGLIGDPGGRDSERPLIDAELARANAEGQRRQIEGLLRNAGVEPVVADNSAWLSPLHLVDFLRDVGKHFTVNWMMAKDSVRARLEDREQGISFTEFSYMLLQAYDFYRLWKDRGVRLQMGASDQWGNITAGIELIRRKEGGEAFGLTCPLLLAPDGRKFGKSVEGAVWLDPRRHSPFRFFQFWINLEDATASHLLAAYTFLPVEEVEAVRAAAAAAPGKRPAQRRLAAEVTALVHGAEAAARAERASRVLFGEGSFRDLDAGTLEEVFEGVERVEVAGDSLGSATLADHFLAARLVTSRSDFARRFREGALQVNGTRVPPDHPGTLSTGEALFGRYFVLRRGKKDYALLRLAGEE